MQATDTSAIQRLIGRARFRIRSQWALEGATTASILAAALAQLLIRDLPRPMHEGDAIRGPGLEDPGCDVSGR